jgi:hypothetical protein
MVHHQQCRSQHRVTNHRLRSLMFSTHGHPVLTRLMSRGAPAGRTPVAADAKPQGSSIFILPPPIVIGSRPHLCRPTVASSAPYTMPVSILNTVASVE